MNAVDIRNLFVLLRSKLKPSEVEEYPADVDEVQGWSPQKRKDYYGRLASILKDIILKKNLQVKFS
jgi:hypothetical protein